MSDEKYTLEEVLSATDAAIKLAEKNDIDINDVTGSGADGNITKKDVELFLEELEKDKPEKATKGEDVSDEDVSDEGETEEEAPVVEEKAPQVKKKKATPRKKPTPSDIVRWRRLGRR